MSSEPTSQFEPETTPEEYRQRALLLADLGRYDEAAGEIAAGLAAAPTDSALLTTLARLHVAAAQPRAALAAADSAVASAPGTVEPLVARAMALVDERRYGDAAQVAGEILTRWPQDAVAQRTGAALLSESRNGQEALNAAWNGVRMAPRDAEAHLVLAVVSARLRLFDLAQRAYSEALDLEPTIADAQLDVGVVRLERRRWAQALEALADEATWEAGQNTPAEDPGKESEEPEARAATAEPTATEPVPPAFGVVRPSVPVLDTSAAVGAALRQAVLYGTNGVMIAAVLSAVMTLSSSGIARTWAGTIGVVVLVALVAWTSRQVRPEPLGAVLGRARGSLPRLVPAFGATLLAPVLLVVFAAVGGVVPLIIAMVLAAVAELLVLTQRS
ncbi:tetratricopeptide repeat protein [Actinoplanes sp. RD1]|uniref:tetratricopeptide repeat protein n=1 Tax=Actinoplanes sp. RD1 TaxID=3064538 RepID=UPI0027427BBC|nr:tetratricopeptide repeat protein [Actinoplanes sp. RD1]